MLISCLKVTGSFKDRGARNVLMCLSEEERMNGVFVGSTGNFARAISYHGRDLGIPVTVVLPRYASLTTITTCAQYGANVVVKGKTHEESMKTAFKLACERNGKFINGHDHLDVMAGAGTIALEILQEVQNIDAVLVPVGGGGLLTGITIATKNISSRIKVIGLESETCPTLRTALTEGRPTVVQPLPSFADGLAMKRVGCNAFYSLKDMIDGVVAIREGSLATGILKMLEEEKIVLEGAGAIGPAALLAGNIEGLLGRRIVCILSGGNIDSSLIGRAIEK
ncbi:L-threonine dehydratase catabolic TdcB, partial [Trichostrongylus colubriformis]